MVLPSGSRKRPKSRRWLSENKRSTAAITARLVGEFLRDAAVLVAVFAPLEWVAQNRPLTPRFSAVTIAIVVAGFVVGVGLEVKRQ